MSGIYIHIPFCKQKCHYCDFASTTSTKYIHEYVDALLIEIKNQKLFFGNQTTINTIYFGGGTPSLLSHTQLGLIIEHLHKYFSISLSAEITIEMNPDNINSEYLHNIKNLGFNRISIGTQSFSNKELQYLHRIHDAETSYKSVLIAKDADFDNISIDIIYGLPPQYSENIQFQIEKIQTLDIAHISAYILTIEADTILSTNIKKGNIAAPNDEFVAKQFVEYINALQALGYEHYEISNYAKSNFQSKHNSAYWEHIPYLGLGTGAHSFINNKRQWNTPYVSKYIEGINNNKPNFDFEILNKTDLYNEFLMQRLRTSEGINIEKLENKFGSTSKKISEQAFQKEISLGNMIFEYPIYRLTTQGKLFSDKVISNCMIVNKK